MSALQFWLRRQTQNIRRALSAFGPPLVMPAAVLTLGACYRPPVDARPTGSWSYEVDAPIAGSRVVTVEATFEGARTERLAIPKDTLPFVRDVSVRTGQSESSFRTVERRGDEWFERSCNARCTVRYRIDLGELAQACGDEVDCARRVDDATLSPSLAWMIHPMPRNDVPVTVRVKTADAAQFSSGMSAADASGANNNTFTFRSFDLDEGSFTAFGPMRRYPILVKGRGNEKARVDVTIVGKKQYAMSDASFRSWIEEAAGVTTQLFGRFPVDRASVFIVPAKGENEVVFGKVLSLAGASVVVVVGDQMPESARHKDWVLVHEMFHLGFPTFRGEGRWLGEGLATYYEPILRARAGWTTETDVYKQFARNMPRGLTGGKNAKGAANAKNANANANVNLGLAHREDLDAIYWGGALFCLAADVRIREETRGQKSLDDVLRATLDHGGDATHVWTVRDVLRIGDLTTGTTVLSDMFDRYAARGDRINLDALFASLGVSIDGLKDPDDSRPLAWIRRGIVDGGSARPSQLAHNAL